MARWQGRLPYLPWWRNSLSTALIFKRAQQRAHSCGRSQNWVIDRSACLLQHPHTVSLRWCLGKAGFVDIMCLKAMWEWSISAKWRSLTDLGVCLAHVATMLTEKAAVEVIIWGFIQIRFLSFFLSCFFPASVKCNKTVNNSLNSVVYFRAARMHIRWLMPGAAPPPVFLLHNMNRLTAVHKSLHYYLINVGMWFCWMCSPSSRTSLH